jgi:hypothetical protein
MKKVRKPAHLTPLSTATLKTLKTSVLGSAGEHYAMCQLLRQGFIAALAPAGVPNCDIVVTDGVGAKLCAIQVKTRLEKGTDGGWHMSRKHETLTAPTLFYVFIDFGANELAPPVSYVVPSRVAADAVRESHATWLAKPSKSGKPHVDSDVRRFMPDYTKVGLDIGRGPGWLSPYREAWAVLGDMGDG